MIKYNLKCRMCSSEHLTTYLNLGNLPLANNLGFSLENAINKYKFPLEVQFCNTCGLSQLSATIDPNILFGHYVYRSGISTGYITHCQNMAKELSNTILFKDDLLVDIAGNDCTLLEEFIKIIPGIKPLNIDPATNLCKLCEEKGIPAINSFMNIDSAIEVINTFGKAKIITATNILAHVENPKSFLEDIKLILKEDGLLIIECPYIEDFIENKQFNQIYHEHISYISITPLWNLCNKLGLEIIDLQKFSIHGGSMRITISHNNSKYPVKEIVKNTLLWEASKGYNNTEMYLKWGMNVKNHISQIKKEILDLKKEGKTIVGIGASAKGNVLLNSMEFNMDIIDAIIDETPEKIGKFSPGIGIPIVHKRYFAKNKPDYVIILAENFKEELMKKAREAGYEGNFIISIPEFQII